MGAMGLDEDITSALSTLDERGKKRNRPGAPPRAADLDPDTPIGLQIHRAKLAALSMEGTRNWKEWDEAHDHWGGRGHKGASPAHDLVSEHRANYNELSKGTTGGEAKYVKEHLSTAASWMKTGDAASRAGDHSKAAEHYGNAKSALAQAKSAVMGSQSLEKVTGSSEHSHVTDMVEGAIQSEKRLG